ncbi:MAG: insulinase family protein [Parcubacteria group bacterium]|nr:insulinase family protein [Parcubacteria group bacterium]
MQFTEKKLPNGIRVIVSPLASTQAVSLLVLIGTGSNYEVKRTNGISHFLEHLFFKGTKSRPRAGDVHRALDGIGAEHNAFTSHEYTGYWVKSAFRHFDMALDVVSDILLEPLFKSDEIERERGVILQEISMYEDMPQRRVSEYFESLLYGDQPAGWDIAGLPETVNNISRGDIVRYKEKQYVASNTVVVVAGNVDPSEAMRKVSKTFVKMSKGHPDHQKKIKEEQKTPGVRMVWKESDQTHLMLGVRAFSLHDKRRYPLLLLSGILGGNTSSRLFMEIREKLGLAYYVGAGAQHYATTGFFSARAGVPHSALPIVVRKITEILHDVCTKGISERELLHIKDYVRGSLALAFETSDEIAFHLGEEALFRKKIIMPEEDLRKLDAVTRADIQRLAREILKPAQLNLAVVGPHRSGSAYQKVLLKL